MIFLLSRLCVNQALAFSFAMRYHSPGENRQTLAATIHLITPRVTLTIYPDTEKRYKVGYIWVGDDYQAAVALHNQMK
jgi:hypothetical protein